MPSSDTSWGLTYEVGTRTEIKRTPRPPRMLHTAEGFNNSYCWLSVSVSKQSESLTYRVGGPPTDADR